MCLQVTGKQVSEVRRNPSLPYMTSSLLTDAANQLGSSVAATMSNAQALFEGGAGGKAATALVSLSLCLRDVCRWRLEQLDHLHFGSCPFLFFFVLLFFPPLPLLPVWPALVRSPLAERLLDHL